MVDLVQTVRDGCRGCATLVRAADQYITNYRPSAVDYVILGTFAAGGAVLGGLAPGSEESIQATMQNLDCSRGEVLGTLAGMCGLLGVGFGAAGVLMKNAAIGAVRLAEQYTNRSEETS